MLQRLFLFLFGLIPLFAFSQVVDPVSWTIAASEVGEGSIMVRATGKIDKGWYIYDTKEVVNGPIATSLTFTLPNGVIAKGENVIATNIKREFDSIFESVIGKGYDSVVVEQILLTEEVGTFKIGAQIEWQACNDISCISPATKNFEIEVTTTQKSSFEATSDSKLGLGGISLAKIIEAILWGFAALLTPCVFPMVPMTISYFMKNNKNKRSAKASALLFGLSIIVLYTLPVAILIGSTYFFGGDAITANIFNFLATHYIPNVIFFLLFVAFAASFFGAFEISLPSKLINSSDKRVVNGEFGSIFFMALTLVLVSFSCTGPIVGSVLVNSTTGAIAEPIITMALFSAAFALPFTLLALFPSLLQKVPKSGGWLSSVKVVLGFIELALSLKFLSVADQTYHWGLLNREIYLALWIVIFTLMGFYLLGKLRFKYESKVETLTFSRLILAVATFTFVVYLIPGLFGAPLKALSGYLPPLSSQEFVLPTSFSDAKVADNTTKNVTQRKYSDFLKLPYGLNGYFTYEEGLVASEAEDKPILLIFTGHGCVNCREMEAVVWSDDTVLDLLRNKFILVSLYTDDKQMLPKEDWIVLPSGKTIKRLGGVNSQLQIDKFSVNAQPYYVITDQRGKMLSNPMGYNLNITTFAEFLQEGIVAYEKNKGENNQIYN